MKILFIQRGMHPKNANALMKYNKNITCVLVNHPADLEKMDLSAFDVVYSPCFPIDIKKYSTTKFLFGPHFSVFPNENDMKMIEGSNAIYVQPSEWVKTLWMGFRICKNIRLESMPFGVDTDKFSSCKDRSQRKNVFIYYKRRRPEELDFVLTFLKSHGFDAKVFNYLTKYPEEEYLAYLQESQFAIWLSAHESQGFALEEALSCDVPLLVWNVSSMSQEYSSGYESSPATSIPYWDQRCGEYFTDSSQLSNIFNQFIHNLLHYQPREFVLDHLSIQKCEQYFVDIVNKI